MTILSPALAPILDRIRARLLELPSDVLYAAGIAANTGVATSFDKKGVRKEPVAFTAKFKNGAAVVKALKIGSLPILECEIWILEIVDRAQALEESVAIRALPPTDVTFKYQYDLVNSFEALVRARALYVVSRCVDLLPIETVVTLAGRGDLLVSMAEGSLAKHPGLQEGELILRALQTTTTATSDLWNASPSPRDADLARYLVRRLVELRYEPAVAALGLRLGERLLQIGSPTALELLARALEDSVLDTDDPSMPPRDAALRALFRLDPRHAYDRLSRYLDESTIGEDPAKGSMRAVIHVLAQDRKSRAAGYTPGFYDADPHWAALIERMARNDPEWERYAWSFQDLSMGELDTRLQAWKRRHEPPPPSLPRKKRLAGIRREDRARARGDASMPAASKLDRVNPALIDAAITAIDARLSGQLDEILHHPDFQALERGWRGLWFLVEQTNFAENIRILILDWTKDDLRTDLTRPGGLATSLLFGIVCTAEYGRVGGEPYGAILADFAFGPDADDLALVQRAGVVAQAALAPFIAAASPAFFAFGLRYFKTCDELRATLATELTAWSTFRGTEEARFVGLTGPRFLLRDTYGADHTPIRAFAYEEQIPEPEARCWGRTTYALASRLVESFARHRWCPNILYADGGEIAGLPLQISALEDGGSARIPIEFFIGERTGFALSEIGLIPFACAREGSIARFDYAPSARQPIELPDTTEGGAAEHDMRRDLELPYLFIVTRLLHYLRANHRGHGASWGSRARVEEELTTWIGRYVDDRIVISSAARARRPLRKARIRVVEDPSGDEAGRRLELQVQAGFRCDGRYFTLTIASRLDS